jgi:hypothetical protein
MEPIENLPAVKIGPRVEREIRARIRELKERLAYNRGVSRYVSTAETNCARWRRESVPVWLREKGFEAPVYGCVFVST